MNRDDLQMAGVLSKYTLAQQEKDYYQYKILSYISEEGGLLFKGGTALAKAHGLPRFSEDLDFDAMGTPDGLPERMERLAKWLTAGGERTVLKDENRTATSYAVRLSIEGILFREDPRGRCGVEIDISLREKARLEPDVQELAPRYSDILPFMFAIMQPQEIAAEKARALLMRSRARDLFDLHYLLCRKGIRLDWGLVQTKLQAEGIRGDKKILAERMGGLSKVWKSELGPLVRILPPFEKIFVEMRRVVENGV